MSHLLKELRRSGESLESFGRKVGRSKSVMSRVVNGKVSVSRALARRIFEETEGRITPNHLYDIGVPAPPSGSS